MESCDSVSLDHILSSARSFEECLEEDHFPNTSEKKKSEKSVDDHVRKSLERWKETIGGDGDTFAKRLEWGGLDADSVKERLRSSGVRPNGMPEWMNFFTEAYGDGPDALSEKFNQLPNLPDRSLQSSDPIPFQSLYTPLIRTARKYLRQAVPDTEYELFSGDAHADLERDLLRRLSKVASRALQVQFDVYRSCHSTLPPLQVGTTSTFDDYIATMKGGQLWRFFETYGVAARMCSKISLMWVDYVSELIGRISKDKEQIRKTFTQDGSLGKVISIQPGLSDPHDGGKTVAILTFDQGPKVVYKPRSVRLDRFFADLLSWLNEHDPPARMRPMKVVNREAYGWVEHVSHEPCSDETDAERFYMRCGMLLCLAYALDGHDFHRENLIASGEHPHLIDMEALLRHQFRLEDATENTGRRAEGATNSKQRSVLGVGLLPMVRVEKEGRAENLGGIATEKSSRREMEVKRFKHINTDMMTLVTETIEGKNEKNRLIVENSGEEKNIYKYPKNYIDEIVNGFHKTYSIISENDRALLDGPLRWLEDADVRFIFRNTSLYGKIVRQSVHPKYLRSGVKRGITYEALYKPLLKMDKRPDVWPIVSEEKKAMNQLDIPLFTANSGERDLHLPNGEVIEDCFECSAFEATRSKIERMSPHDLQKQCRLIKLSFELNRAQSFRSLKDTEAWEIPVSCDTGSVVDRTEAIRYARRIARKLQTTSASVGDETPVWFAGRYDPAGRCYSVELGGHDLISGNAGIALFFSALEQVDGERNYRSMTLSAINPIRENISEIKKRLKTHDSVNLGIGTGAGACVYALTVLATRLNRTDLLKDAHKLGKLFDEDRFIKGLHTGLLAGTAGAVLSMLALYDASGNLGVLNRARKGASLLLKRTKTDSQTGDRVSSTFATDMQSGVARGAAGVAYAFVRTYQTLRNSPLDANKRFLNAALEAFEQDQIHADKKSIDRAEKDASWGNGATGRGLMLLPFLDIAVIPEVQEKKIEAVIESYAGDVLKLIYCGSDTLGCGRMGRVEFLLSAGLKLGRSEWVSAARRALNPRRKSEEAEIDYVTDWDPGNCDPGLFHGVAGIGYELLRASHPEQLPSLLMFKN